MKRSPLRSVSRKRAAENRTYTKLRAEFLAEHPRCEFPGCQSAATEVHHRAGRAGHRLLLVCQFAALCHDHHTYLTEHPTAAYESGLSERRHSA